MQYDCRSLRCSWSIACRRCSNYIFILDLTPGFIGLGKDNCTTRRETSKFGDLARLRFYGTSTLLIQQNMKFYWLLSTGVHMVHMVPSQHYDDVIMSALASQITILTIVYSIVYSDADQRKHQSSASLAFVWGIHRDRWIPRTNGQLRGKCFHLMTSSWNFVRWIANIFIHNVGQNIEHTLHVSVLSHNRSSRKLSFASMGWCKKDVSSVR